MAPDPIANGFHATANRAVQADGGAELLAHFPIKPGWCDSTQVENAPMDKPIDFALPREEIELRAGSAT